MEALKILMKLKYYEPQYNPAHIIYFYSLSSKNVDGIDYNLKFGLKFLFVSIP